MNTNRASLIEEYARNRFIERYFDARSESFEIEAFTLLSLKYGAKASAIRIEVKENQRKENEQTRHNHYQEPDRSCRATG